MVRGPARTRTSSEAWVLALDSYDVPLAQGVAVADLDTDVVDATRARHTMLADHRDTLGERDVIRIEG